MKRSNAWLSVTLALLSLAACGDKKSDDDDSAGESGTGAIGGATGGAGGASGSGAVAGSGGAGASTGGAGGSAAAGRGGAAGTSSGAAGRGGSSGADGGAGSNGGAAGKAGGSGGSMSGAGGSAAGAGGGAGFAAGGGAAGGDGSGGSAGMASTQPIPCQVICGWDAECTTMANCATDCAAAYTTNPECQSVADACAACLEARELACDAETTCATALQDYRDTCESAANSCPFANDGACDDPGFCDPGTDTADCS